MKRSEFIEEKKVHFLDSLTKNQPILSSEDIEIITNNKVDTGENEKNNYIIKIRKY